MAAAYENFCLYTYFSTRRYDVAPKNSVFARWFAGVAAGPEDAPPELDWDDSASDSGSEDEELTFDFRDVVDTLELEHGRPPVSQWAGLTLEDEATNANTNGGEVIIAPDPNAPDQHEITTDDLAELGLGDPDSEEDDDDENGR